MNTEKVIEPIETSNTEAIIKRLLCRSGIFPTWMLSRTPLCRHTKSCYENVIAGFLRMLLFGYALKLV